MIWHDDFKVLGCRACRRVALTPVLNLGTSPLANAYLTEEQLTCHEQEWPLEVVLCEVCGCVQLCHTVDPELLFHDYLYMTGDSGTLARHYEEYARETVAQLGLVPGEDFIVGIGGNDGTLEMAYQDMRFDVLNVEPAQRVAALSAERVPTLNRWFTEELVRDLDLAGKAALVTCNNCFAHIPDVREVMRGVKALLKPEGWFVVEGADLEATLQGNHFDQFYHEHVFYWHAAAFAQLMDRFDMSLWQWERHEEQGGSFRAFVRNSAHTKWPMPTQPKDLPAQFVQLRTYISHWREEKYGDLNMEFVNRNSVACYGWPAKATLISKLLDFKHRNIMYAVDDMPSKQGMFTPGSHIPIVSREHFVKHPPDVCLVTASNYAEEIVKSNSQFKGRWITLP